MKLPTELRYRALHNRACFPLYQHYAESIKAAIIFGFDWAATPEGFDFWLHNLPNTMNQPQLHLTH